MLHSLGTAVSWQLLLDHERFTVAVHLLTYWCMNKWLWQEGLVFVWRLSWFPVIFLTSAAPQHCHDCTCTGAVLARQAERRVAQQCTTPRHRHTANPGSQA